MIRISIISPIKNETQTLKELVKRVSKVMNSNYRNNWEYVMINDASDDGSKELMESLAKKNSSLIVLNHMKSHGQTGCFETGFKHARGNIIVTMDGDLQVIPEDIPMFISKIEEGYDVVNGIRENRSHTFWINLASRIYNVLMYMLFQCPVMDGASNFTAFRARYVKSIRLRDNDHRYIIPIVMWRGAKKIGEVIIKHYPRISGKSKYSSLPKYIKGFPEIFIAFIRIRSGVYD